MKAKFEKQVDYLKRNVPEEDIYIFAEQTFMATMFFLYKWCEWVDMKEECEKDPVAKKWINNILGFQKLRDDDIDINVDLNLKSIEPNEDSD